ncbi:MAG: MATE family efflux transporter [Clostridia bacterium]|nr:MATE family efflux transporter [Clostridia bacterium]
MKSRYIGDKAFYRRALALAVPIMIQTGITNFVNMLDNLMVGSVGTEAMTGVAVSNQLIFIFNLCVYGAVTGAGIFTAQYFGKGDNNGIRYTFRFKIIVCLLISLIFGAVIFSSGENILGLYLKGEGSLASAKASAKVAISYTQIMFIGVIPYALTQCYGSTLRETGRPKVPMYAGVLAVLLNLSLNYVLIFGHLGFPRLGTNGAAIATVISRFAELLYVAVGAHIGKKSEFIKGAFRSFRVPFVLVKKMAYKGTPLLLNEFFWSTGIAFINQCYSVRGLAVVAADNIVLAFFNVFSVVFFAVGISIGIIEGQILGAGKTDEAMDTAVKMRAFSVLTAIIVGAAFALFSGLIPKMYNTTDEVRDLAKWMIIITALSMPVDAFAQSSYFTLRSGGKVLTTIVFDSLFVWVVSVPFAFLVSRYTDLPILPFYALSLALNILKCVLGYFYVKKGSWIKNLVNDTV